MLIGLLAKYFIRPTQQALRPAKPFGTKERCPRILEHLEWPSASPHATLPNRLLTPTSSGRTACTLPFTSTKSPSKSRRKHLMWSLKIAFMSMTQLLFLLVMTPTTSSRTCKMWCSKICLLALKQIQEPLSNRKIGTKLWPITTLRVKIPFMTFNQMKYSNAHKRSLKRLACPCRNAKILMRKLETGFGTFTMFPSSRNWSPYVLSSINFSLLSSELTCMRFIRSLCTTQSGMLNSLNAPI